MSQQEQTQRQKNLQQEYPPTEVPDLLGLGPSPGTTTSHPSPLIAPAGKNSTITDLSNVLESTLHQLMDLLTPNVLVSRRAGQLVSANSSLCSKQVKPRQTPSVARIYICMDQSAILTLTRQFDWKPKFQSTEELNGTAGALLANTSYMFDILMDEGETFDLTYGTASTIQQLLIIEIDTPT